MDIYIYVYMHMYIYLYTLRDRTLPGRGGDGASNRSSSEFCLAFALLYNYDCIHEFTTKSSSPCHAVA